MLTGWALLFLFFCHRHFVEEPRRPNPGWHYEPVALSASSSNTLSTSYLPPTFPPPDLPPPSPYAHYTSDPPRPRPSAPPARTLPLSSLPPRLSSPAPTTRSFTSSPTPITLFSATSRAASNRLGLDLASSAPSLLPLKKAAAPRPPSSSSLKSGAKQSRTDPVTCRVCHSTFADAVLRGTRNELAVAFRASWACVKCVPLPALSVREKKKIEEEEAGAGGEGGDGGEVGGSEDFGVRYEDTLSAAVDRFEGLQLGEDPRPPLGRARGSGSGRKRKAQEREVVTCACFSLFLEFLDLPVVARGVWR